jgi:rhodanese-related sulfurtransferase
MGEFISFFQSHPYLGLATIASFILVLAYEAHRKSISLNHVTPQQAILLMNKNAAIYDLRNQKEYDQGHILNAINHPSQLSESDPKIDKQKTKIILLACSSGASSGKEAIRLNKVGFKTVYSINGGMAAWAAAGLPYQTKQT